MVLEISYHISIQKDIEIYKVATGNRTRKHFIGCYLRT
jgi:hypothetical protein